MESDASWTGKCVISQVECLSDNNIVNISTVNITMELDSNFTFYVDKVV